MSVTFGCKRFIVTMVEIWRYLLLIDLCMAQLNRPPDFVSDGDMSWLAIKEDIPIGSSVYTLMAIDPEGSRISYNIISSHFTVDRISGVVTLTKPLDREVQDSLEVFISATDEKLVDTPANTTELKRQVTILDVNDNVPYFSNATYIFSVEESTAVGTVVYGDLQVTDSDIGINAEISLQCLSPVSPFACEKFEVEANQLAPGRYQGVVRLKKTLDYEEASLYILTVKAEDVSPKNRQSINMVVEIIDHQDQPPVFVNSPYFWTIRSNGTENRTLFLVHVYDGDRGRPRPLDIRLIDPGEYFDISVSSNNDLRYTVNITASENLFDNEVGFVKRNDGFYQFHLKATEIEDGHLTSVFSETTVTVFTSHYDPPKWSNQECNVTVLKDQLRLNSHLNDCNLYVSGDEKYKIYLNSTDESSDIFEIEPKEAKGTTSVRISVKNATGIVFDGLQYEFQIIASDSQGMASSVFVVVDVVESTEITLSFAKGQYDVNVSESLAPGSFITQITVNNDNFDDIQTIVYSIEGFGSPWFNVNAATGNIHLANCGSSSCLDFEKISKLSLVYMASDSLGNRAVTDLSLQITDVNDNPPLFVNREVVYNLSPKTDRFDPPLKLEAIDIDSSSEGNNNITYKIMETSPPSDAFAIDRFGEIKFNTALLTRNDSYHAKRFKIHVIAEDMGSPPLSSDAYAIVTLEKEVEGNLYFTHAVYNATILESDLEGKEILQVAVVDPTLQAQNIIYRIINGSFDNFIIDSHTGIITIAPDSVLDLEKSPKFYQLQLEAVNVDDSSNQSTSAMVEIKVEDINDKPPKFTQSYYVYYISDDDSANDPILTVRAEDPDVDSRVQYFLVEILLARDGNGLLVSTGTLNMLKDVFKVDSSNGTIEVLSKFDRLSFSTLCLSVGARDSNTVGGTDQSAEVEVFLIVKRKKDLNPVFPHPWSPTSPQIYFSIPEEAPIGSKLFTLTAKCFDDESEITYEWLSDNDGYFDGDKISGVVTIRKRLDYEALPVDGKRVSFVVKAVKNGQYSSTATVMVDIVDINDNSPIFLNDSYWRQIPESAKFPDAVVTVNAMDHDRQYGFGDIRYSLTGDSDANAFDIDPITGAIMLAKGKHLDREKKAIYNLKATAIDNPDGIDNHRQSSVLIVVELVDVNDNHPVFTDPLYQAIFPETVAPEFIIRQIEATDADLGENSRIRYSLDEKSQLKDFIAVNETNGILFVKKVLSGNGRSEPYKLIITASDHGDPPLSTDVHVLLFVTDVTSNDGVPVLIKPQNGDVVDLPENSPPGTVITTLEVANSGDPKTENGLLRYSFLGDSGPESDEKHFAIDPVKGILTSRYSLDRELQSNYTIVLMVKDFEDPPNQLSLSLTINIVDVDDHFPTFRRPKNSHPIPMEVYENVSLNTIIGYVEAVDDDEGPNAAVEYVIIDPATKDLVFTINRTIDNKGAIYVAKKLDCETKDNYLLTVQARRWDSEDIRKGKYILMATDPSLLLDNEEQEKANRYDPSILSLVQIRIWVKDVDDYDPYFIHGNTSTWIKSSTKPGDTVFRFIAKDDDASGTSILYRMTNIYFTIHDSQSDSALVFNLDERTGILRLRRPVLSYENGFFEVEVEAVSNNKSTFCRLTIYVLQNRELLKFVFNRPMVELKSDLTEFKQGLQESLLTESSVSADFLDTPFVKQEAIANVSSICFQFIKEGHESLVNEAETLLDLFNNPALDTLYNKYGVQKVEKCESDGTLYTMNWVDISILVIASLIVIVSAICCFIICHLYKRYKTKLQQRTGKLLQHHSDNNSNYGYTAVSNQRIYEWQKRSAPLNLSR